MSERRACRALDQSRSSQRYRPLTDEEEKRLIAEMLALVGQHPRYGYRRIWALLRRSGWRVNRKRIYRLWVQEGLKVPQKQRKRRRLGHSENSCVRRKAEHKDHVWTWDFIHDRTTNGRPLKWLSIVDEYTRECLALEVDRSITAEKVIDVLAELFRIRAVPKHIRSDNGPEFIAQAIRRWLSLAGVETLYVGNRQRIASGYETADRRTARFRRRRTRASRDSSSRCSSRCSGWAATQRSGSKASRAAVSPGAMVGMAGVVTQHSLGAEPDSWQLFRESCMIGRCPGHYRVEAGLSWT